MTVFGIAFDLRTRSAKKLIKTSTIDDLTIQVPPDGCAIVQYDEQEHPDLNMTNIKRWHVTTEGLLVRKKVVTFVADKTEIMADSRDICRVVAHGLEYSCTVWVTRKTHIVGEQLLVKDENAIEITTNYPAYYMVSLDQNAIQYAEPIQIKAMKA